MKILELLKKLFKQKKNNGLNIKFGWKKDLVDSRDYMYKLKIDVPIQLPSLIDLRPKCPPVYDQKTLGSCTANALAGAFQFEQIKQNKINFIPSRLFLYYNERVLEDTVNEDAGAIIRDGIKTLNRDGVCPESIWEYIIEKFNIKPTQNCYDVALSNHILEYIRLTSHSLYEMKHCLADGYPVVFGFMVFESLMSKEVAKTGIMEMPKSNESILGGHAVMAVGYDDSKASLIIRNSWGNKWGLDGYFYMPYEYIGHPDLSADYWTIRLVE